jgi:hypothetical protein
MAIFAAHRAQPIAEEQDILMVSYNVKAKLLIMVIQFSSIQNLGANYLALMHIQNALQVIQIMAAANANSMEIALAHICQEEANHAIRLFNNE